MTLIDYVKTSIRTSTIDVKIIGQIENLINGAKNGLANIGVHSSFIDFDINTDTSEIDSTVSVYVVAHVCWLFPYETSNREQWKAIRDNHLHQIHIYPIYKKERVINDE